MTQSKAQPPKDLVTLHATTTHYGYPFMWDPQVLNLINTSHEVYVFPVINTPEPRRDKKRMRLLEGQARREIVGLLGAAQSWYVGSYTIVHGDVQARSLGLAFRRGTNELVLFFLDWGSPENILQYAEGTFNGRKVADELNRKPAGLLAKWAKRYAETELAAK